LGGIKHQKNLTWIESGGYAQYHLKLKNKNCVFLVKNCKSLVKNLGGKNPKLCWN
jgi:hypothetical protein